MDNINVVLDVPSDAIEVPAVAVSAGHDEDGNSIIVAVVRPNDLANGLVQSLVAKARARGDDNAADMIEELQERFG